MGRFTCRQGVTIIVVALGIPEIKKTARSPSSVGGPGPLLCNNSSHTLPSATHGHADLAAPEADAEVSDPLDDTVFPLREGCGMVSL